MARVEVAPLDGSLLPLSTGRRVIEFYKYHEQVTTVFDYNYELQLRDGGTHERGRPCSQDQLATSCLPSAVRPPLCNNRTIRKACKPVLAAVRLM